MNLMAKSNLLFLGMILAMTVSVLAAGTVVIDDILYRFQERILQLELANAVQAIRQTLHRSGTRAAARQAADLQDALAQREGLHSVRLYVVEAPDQRIVYHPELLAGERAGQEFVASMFERRQGSSEYADDEVSRFAAFATLDPVGWLIVLSISKGEMLAKKFDFLWAIGGITFLVLALNALVISLYGGGLARRLRATLDCVNRIERGDLSARIPAIAERDEIGQLQNGVNAMSERIEQRTRERLAADKALSESRELLQSIIDNSPAVIFVKDLEGRYLMINRRYAELFHVGQDEVVNRCDHDIFPAPLADAFRAFDQRVLAAGTAQQAEEIAPQDDGLHTYLSIKFPLYDESHRAYAVCGIATDITDRKSAEAERHARQAAEAANRAKSAFLAAMSHELRTPLNAILGYAQILRREAGLSERQAGGLDTIRQSGQHLLTLIDDLLDLAKIEAGKLELHPEPVDLAACLATVARIIRVRVEEKGLAFALDIPSALPSTLLADEKRLRQVLLNLLSNAVKFTGRGEVRLKVQIPARTAERAHVHFEVADTGVGIAAGQLETIFQPFEQVGDRQSRASGTGLGLAISRQLVRQMGGEIAVTSEPGRGSRFGFDLNLPLPADAVPAPTASCQIVGYGGRRRKLLVADDVPANRAMLADLLSCLGFDVDQAGNGREVLERIGHIGPDLLLTDLVMPVMDGLQAIGELRRMPAWAGLPVIVVSASATADDAAQALAAGADAFLGKPIEQERLLQEIGRLLGLDWQRAEVAAAGAAEAALPLPLPREELASLHRLAMAGNMRDIRDWAERLAERNARYRPFGEQLQQLARGYQSKAILALVEAQLQEGGRQP